MGELRGGLTPIVSVGERMQHRDGTIEGHPEDDAKTKWTALLRRSIEQAILCLNKRGKWTRTVGSSKPVEHSERGVGRQPIDGVRWTTCCAIKVAVRGLDHCGTPRRTIKGIKFVNADLRVDQGG